MFELTVCGRVGVWVGFVRPLPHELPLVPVGVPRALDDLVVQLPYLLFRLAHLGKGGVEPTHV